MLTFLIFILILSTLVLVHEFGHYITAKKAGVRVEEFGFGIPPRVFGKRIGETLYSINLLPFGGFVKLTGEDPTDVSTADLNDPRSFMSRSPLQRAVFLSAGVIMNLFLGIFLYYVFFSFNNFKSLDMPLFFDYNFRFGNQENVSTVIVSVQEGSAADEVGMEVGEAIVEIAGEAVHTLEDVRGVVGDKAGQEMTILLMDLRDPSHPIRTVTAMPREGKDSIGVLGVYLSESVSLSYEGFWGRVFSAPMHACNMLGYSGYTLVKLIGVSVEEGSLAPVSSSVAGPVGMYSIVENILSYSGNYAYLRLLDLTALMSVTLALINLLPLPALDGGRLLFVVLEKIRGKRVLPKMEACIHKWGMVFLFGFLILMTVRDVFRIFG